MTLNYFRQKSPEGEGERYRSVNIVRCWLAGKSYLPADLRRSLLHLIPELAQDEALRVDDDFSQ